MLPNLRDPVDPSIKACDLNLYLSHVWYMQAPLLADDFQRSCIGTDLNWQVLTVYWQVRNNFGRKRVKDTFGFEWDGSPEEEAINAPIHLQSVQNLKDLPTSELLWETFDVIWGRWLQWMVSLDTVRNGQPLPVPEKPKPAPLPTPAPKPSPTVPETPIPAPSTGGWKPTALSIGLALATLAGILSIASFFVPALAPIAAGLKALGALLQSLGH